MKSFVYTWKKCLKRDLWTQNTVTDDINLFWIEVWIEVFDIL